MRISRSDLSVQKCPLKASDFFCTSENTTTATTHKRTLLQNILCTKAGGRLTSKRLKTNFQPHFHLCPIKCTQALFYSAQTLAWCKFLNVFVCVCVCVFSTLWTWSHNLLIASGRSFLLILRKERSLATGRTFPCSHFTAELCVFVFRCLSRSYGLLTF